MDSFQLTDPAGYAPDLNVRWDDAGFWVIELPVPGGAYKLISARPDTAGKWDFKRGFIDLGGNEPAYLDDTHHVIVDAG
jgi:hypothetical protein